MLVLAAAGAVVDVALLSAVTGEGGGIGPDPFPPPTVSPTGSPADWPVSLQVAVCRDGTGWYAAMPRPACRGHGGVRFWTARIPGSPIPGRGGGGAR